MKKLIPATLLSLAVALPASAQYMDPVLEMHALTHELGMQYDGAYWHYYQHNWFVSQMNGGPWTYVEPVYVPVYVQQVPIRYGRRPRDAQVVDPVLARKLQSNPQMPTDAAVKSYFSGATTGAAVPTTGIERAPRR